MDEIKAGKRICKILNQSGHIAFFAGGCVRDSLMGIKPKDIDIATSATPEQIEKIFKSTKAVGKAFGVILVKFGGHDFEIATFRKDIGSDTRRPLGVEFSSPEEDSKRRDLTINSIFFDPSKKAYIDFEGGINDIENRIIRFTGDPSQRIKEDYLRILRACRFKISLGFEFDPTTKEAIKENSHLISEISPERVRQELMKMISLYKPSEMLDVLFDMNIIDYVIPELRDIKGCLQNPKYHSEGDVFVHTKLVAENCAKYKDELLMLAAILHDIGKPVAFSIDEDGKISSKGHEKEGADIAETVMRRLKFSNDDIKQVVSLVRDHMKPHFASDMKKSSIKKLLSQENIDSLIMLAKADEDGRTSGNYKYPGWKLIVEAKERFAAAEEQVGPDPIVTGKTLIALGLKPGPQFKELLSRAYEIQLENCDKTREEIVKEVLDGREAEYAT